ncbi:unnamed protein product [Linum trigynum]|uniref:Uncharacterized protein n=1 Tax=Linum trigynum TaxID=586398 RepID=A0AAV2F2C8_9ROSI
MKFWSDPISTLLGLDGIPVRSGFNQKVDADCFLSQSPTRTIGQSLIPPLSSPISRRSTSSLLRFFCSLYLPDSSSPSLRYQNPTQLSTHAHHRLRRCPLHRDSTNKVWILAMMSTRILAAMSAGQRLCMSSSGAVSVGASVEFEKRETRLAV